MVYYIIVMWDITTGVAEWKVTGSLYIISYNFIWVNIILKF